jgi:hypothetical protein
VTQHKTPLAPLQYHLIVHTVVFFSVSNQLISDAFPAEVQSLAGSVFNTLAQFGNSVGLTLTATIAASVTEHSAHADSKVALMDGFRAAFWTIFASTATVLVVSSLGLRNAGIVATASPDEVIEDISEEVKTV